MVTALDYSSRSITANDSSAAGDNGKTIVIASTVTAAVTLSLMDAATAAAGYIVTVSNESSVTCTVGRATASNTISGTTSDFSLPPLAAITFVVAPSGVGYSIKSTVGVTLTGSQTLTNKTLTSPVIDTAVTGTAIATQAQQEAGAAVNVLVTPGRQQYHASSAKVWLAMKWVATVPTSQASMNVSSLTDNGVGDVTVNFTTAFSSANFSTVVGWQSMDTSLQQQASISAQATTSLKITYINGAGAGDNTNIVSIACYGDQ